MELLIVPTLAILALIAPLLGALGGKLSAKRAGRRLIINLCMFCGLCLLSIIFPATRAAATGTDVVGAGASDGLGYIAAALSTGLASVGAGIAVAAGAPAAIGAISEDAKNFGKAIIFVVLGEGIAIYGLLISMQILTKLG